MHSIRFLIPICLLLLADASIAALPDWSGNWVPIPGDGLSAADPPPVSDNPAVPQYTPKAVQMRRLAKADPNYVPNQAACIPKGMPLDMGTTAVAFEFLFTPGRVTVIWENGFVRRIYTDGRRHAEEPNPSFAGDSIGHWEGNTLVVDTTSIIKGAELGPLLTETGKTHVVERMSRKSADVFQIEFTVTDEDLLSRPWVFTRTYKHSTYPLMEFVCTQNNRDNNKEVDLTPPP